MNFSKKDKIDLCMGSTNDNFKFLLTVIIFLPQLIFVKMITGGVGYLYLTH